MLIKGVAYLYKQGNRVGITGIWENLEALNLNEEWVHGASEVYGVVPVDVTINVPQYAVDILNATVNVEGEAE